MVIHLSVQIEKKWMVLDSGKTDTGRFIWEKSLTTSGTAYT
jgi:hypothetical protein